MNKYMQVGLFCALSSALFLSTSNIFCQREETNQEEESERRGPVEAAFDVVSAPVKAVKRVVVGESPEQMIRRSRDLKERAKSLHRAAKMAEEEEDFRRADNLRKEVGSLRREAKDLRKKADDLRKRESKEKRRAHREEKEPQKRIRYEKKPKKEEVPSRKKVNKTEFMDM